MLVWFLLALSAAIFNSMSQGVQRHAVHISGYSKMTITFIITAIASAILFAASYFVVGFPAIGDKFWLSIVVTGVLNGLAWPIMLRAYEIGEFSSVYSMILLTPAFLLATSFVFLGEAPSLIGACGVLLTVLGLWMVASQHEHTAVPNFAKGNWLGILAAGIFSISINFDKLTVQNSDRFFGSAAILAVVAIGSLAYLLVRHHRIFIRTESVRSTYAPLLFLSMSVLLVLAYFAHNSALLAGLASYTIAVKRLGVLFGVVWGWLFFKEKNISRKALGAAIALAGVIAIVLS